MVTNSFDKFPPSSRVWVYQSNREILPDQINNINLQLSSFIKNWTAHNQALNAAFEIRWNRFIILMVDETHAGASGCSIDKSVHFLQSIESQYSIDLFDRNLFAYEMNSKVLCISKKDFEEKIQKGEINRETKVFNNLVRTKDELERLWYVPLKESWFGEYFAQSLKKETWA